MNEDDTGDTNESGGDGHNLSLDLGDPGPDDAVGDEEADTEDAACPDGPDCYSEEPVALGKSTAYCQKCGAPTMRIEAPIVGEED